MNLLLIVLVRAKTNLLFEVSTENRSNQVFQYYYAISFFFFYIFPKTTKA